MVSYQRTVWWEDGQVALIDQRALPSRVRIIKCQNYGQVAEAIKKMAIRGAPAIGVGAALALALAAHHSRATEKEALMRDLETAAITLQHTRPTGANLFWAIDRIMKRASSTNEDVKVIVEAVKTEALLMAEEDLRVNLALGTQGSQLIDDGDVVLTHCKWPS